MLILIKNVLKENSLKTETFNPVWKGVKNGSSMMKSKKTTVNKNPPFFFRKNMVTLMWGVSERLKLLSREYTFSKVFKKGMK